MNPFTLVFIMLFVLLAAVIYFDVKKARAIRAACAEGGKVYRVVGRVATDVYSDGSIFLRDELFGQVVGYEYGEYVMHIRDDMLWLADMYVQEGILTEA